MLLLIGGGFFYASNAIRWWKAKGFGKSKAKLLNEAAGKVTFDDVAELMKQNKNLKK